MVFKKYVTVVRGNYNVTVTPMAINLHLYCKIIFIFKYLYCTWDEKSLL